MNLQEFVTSLKRVEGVFGEIPQPVVSELKDRYFHTSPEMWDRMCTHVIDHVRVTPKPAHWKEAYEAILQTYKAPERGPSRMTSEAHQEWCQSTAHMMSPAGARYVLGMVDKGKVRFSDEVLKILIERSAADKKSEEWEEAKEEGKSHETHESAGKVNRS